jgi:hypothetical protein
MTLIALFRALAHPRAWWRGNGTSAESTGRRRQDKSGSPVDRQAIGMACLSPCRSVGSRAAPKTFANNINAFFGTMVHFDVQGLAS